MARILIIFKTGALIGLLLLATGSLIAGEEAETPANELVSRYCGSYDTDALLREPFVNERLVSLLGPEMDHFMENLNVRGSVDLVSGALSVAGNAAHHGGEEEAVLCVSTYNRDVSAALLSDGVITIYSSASDYQSLNLCIKDWVTQANSGHNDRFVAPANVRMSKIRQD